MRSCRIRSRQPQKLLRTHKQVRPEEIQAGFRMRRPACFVLRKNANARWWFRFWVARTKKGGASLKSSPLAVIFFSCIASRRAAWVFGGVRLISSAKTIFAKIGPLEKTNSLLPVSGWSLCLSVILQLGKRVSEVLHQPRQLLFESEQHLWE